MGAPTHIGLILDGNRRFAKTLNEDPWKGHEYGYKKVLDLLKWCKEFQIKELTLYVFSMQNFNRPKKEFDYLMKLFMKAANEAFSKDSKEKINENLNVKFIGRIKLLPKDVQDAIKKIELRTKRNNEYQLNIAIAYGGREEIEDAVKKIAKDVKQGKLSPLKITSDTINEYVYLNSSPDLIIRTGGEKRTSNFLLWQSPYSEWIFLDKKWPEFTKQDLEQALKEYSQRERRIGK
jgi:tritrans,polycis-undecaprenyl-diphosphate synthase [geranylgeranyl-diphosphate specific]